MTVCIAALFNWAYEDGARGEAILTASDRMLTAGDMEYEAARRKLCIISPKILILVAGEMAAHSEAMHRCYRQFQAVPETDVAPVAEIYGGFLNGYRARQAEKTYLAPLGLTLESFVEKQRDMSPAFVAEIVAQLQNYRIDVEAIVAGIDGFGAQIYHIDDAGFCRNQSDINFASIGMGYHHANSLFTSMRYSNQCDFPTSLMAVYAAKKMGETAPGVGLVTDVHLITSAGATMVDTDMMGKVEASYAEYEQDRQALFQSAIGRLLIAPATLQAEVGDPAS